MGRTPRWELKCPEREGKLTLSIFPVAAGITMDLPTLVRLDHERRRKSAEVSARLRASARAPWVMRQRLLDESTWSTGPVFCVAIRHTWEVPAGREDAWPGTPVGRVNHRAGWTLCDGRYVVEAGLGDLDAATYGESVAECDAMMRSVRLEGPS